MNNSLTPFIKQNVFWETNICLATQIVHFN